MPDPGFSRYILRTTDVESATRFYDTILGHRGDGILPLHEAALARGARPHWLGHVAVGDLGGVERVVNQFVERGATHLGPPKGVGDFAVLRDPGGAVVALTEASESSSAGVVWHQLNTNDAPTAQANYTTLFGWSLTEPVDLGALGRHQRFAYGAGEVSVGIISDIEGRPGVHTHWLFFFSVPSLDRALDQVLAHQGKVFGPLSLPNGARVAACDDPQGAAFGLVEAGDVALLG